MSFELWTHFGLKFEIFRIIFRPSPAYCVRHTILAVNPPFDLSQPPAPYFMAGFVVIHRIKIINDDTYHTTHGDPRSMKLNMHQSTFPWIILWGMATRTASVGNWVPIRSRNHVWTTPTLLLQRSDLKHQRNAVDFETDVNLSRSRTSLWNWKIVPHLFKRKTPDWN
jgi:hypothetical protein